MMLDDQATPQLRRGSGQIAADRVLDLKRFGLPPRVLAAAQPGLGCCPPRTAVPVGEHHPIPGLDDPLRQVRAGHPSATLTRRLLASRPVLRPSRWQALMPLELVVSPLTLAATATLVQGPRSLLG
jgi:hypothetical protein